MFERAIAIDPNFAMPYYLLGVEYEVAGDMARFREYSTQAFRLIDRVSEFERDQIAPFYYRNTGELDKAIGRHRRHPASESGAGNVPTAAVVATGTTPRPIRATTAGMPAW
jgi:hypothetical protein